MFLGPVFYGCLGRTRIIARCFWALIGFMIFHLRVCMTVLLLVPDMLAMFWVRPYLVLSINFLAVISPFVNDLFITLNPLEGLGYSLSFVSICCKVLVPFLFIFSFSFLFCVDSSVAWIRQARSCHLYLLEGCACGGLLPSRRALLVWPMYFKGHFFCVYGFVGDLHPSKWNLIT